MHPRKSRFLTCLAAMSLLLVATWPAGAFVQPQDSPIQGKIFLHPDLQILNGYIPASEAQARGQAKASTDLSALGVAPEAAYMDARTGRWGTLMPATPMFPGKGVGNNLTWQSLGRNAPSSPVEHKAVVWETFLAYLQAHQGSLGIDIGQLPRLGTVTIHDGGDTIQIYAPRVVDGLPVRDSYLTATVKFGNLILFGAVNWNDVEVATQPSITAGAAQGVAEAYVGTVEAASHWAKPGLVLMPWSVGDNLSDMAVGQGLDYRLVWTFRANFAGDHGNYEALVDAHSGEILSFQDTNHYAAAAGVEPEGTATARTVIGGVLPVSNDGVGGDGTEQVYPMPFVDLEIGGDTHFTDSGGNLLACVDGTVTTKLSGLYMNMVDNCGAISESSSGAVLDLGTSGGTDCTVPPGASPGNTHASRSGFYEMNRIIEQARGIIPNNAWLGNTLTSNMNINSTCNAFWSGSTVNFYRSGGGCFNTGELAGVFDHEWGHGMDNNDAVPTISNPGEGIPDVYASLRLNTSCIGRNFRASNCSGYGDGCLNCTGVRDIDWAKRVSGMPHAINGAQGINALCGSGGGAPCGGSSHCEGAAYSESVWDLWNRDLITAGFNVETARELAVRMTYVGAGNVGTWFQCAAPFGGCAATGGYLNFLAADDDDGNINNGTPHIESIFAAFNRHEIACATPTPTNSGCASAPTVAPTVTIDPSDRGAELSWGAVANADSYLIYRGEGVNGCDFGKQLVGETTGLSFQDSGMQNGFEYFYIVVPKSDDGDTCFGPASTCSSVTPTAGANLAVVQGSGNLTINTGDSDPFLDNCETATMTFDVSNIGDAAQTNVRIVNISSPSHPVMDPGFVPSNPISANLAACGEGQASFNFQAAGLAFNEVVTIEVEVTSDELSPQTRTGVFQIQSVESDFQNFPSRTFSMETDEEGWTVTGGTFVRTGGDGSDGTFAFRSSTLLDNACDVIRSPVVSMNANTTLSLESNFDIEPMSGGTWYDRASVGIVDASGVRTPVDPDSGRLYNADSSGPGNYGGCNEPEQGWAGTMQTWAPSGFSATALGSAGLAGQLVQFEVIYGTDGALAQGGFWFDEITMTNVDVQVPDTQVDCLDLGIFSGDFETGDTSQWSNDFP